MRRMSGTSLVALATAMLLASLSLVAWRQARAMEALAALEESRIERTLGLAEREELESRIRVLESRGRVVPEARARLGMRMPEASEIVFLTANEAEGVQ
jgi:cell division protein FtsB